MTPLTNALNLESLKLDFNAFGPLFLERLTQNMLTDRKLPMGTILEKDRSKSSLITDKSIYLNDAEISLDTSFKKTNIGLTLLSLEGNQLIGDRGAAALATIIMNPVDNTKQLKMINLNACGLSNAGFEHLREALMQRGNLAVNANLSHVKITIERNNINY